MAVVFDSDKDLANIAKHGVYLALSEKLEVVASIIDARRDYGELRKIAFGTIDGDHYTFVYTLRDDQVRAISLRRCHRKEFLRYVPRG